MKDVTICFTYFKTLSLLNLAASLYSVSRQDMSRVAEIVIVDNDTTDAKEEIKKVIAEQSFAAPVRFVSVRHGDPTRAQAWSTNFTVRLAKTPWVFYTRADYLLDFTMLEKFLAVVDSKPANWDGFIVSNGTYLNQDVGWCELTNWRTAGPYVLMGIKYDHTEIDAGVWMARRDMYDRVGGFDERLSAWGHATTEFQHRVYLDGVEFVRIREELFHHPLHSGERDINVGHQQLRDIGLDIRTLWERYEGPKYY